MRSIDLQKDINIADSAALAIAQTDTNWASELREEGWVCGETRERKCSAIQSKQEGFSSTGAAFVRESVGDDKEEGGVIIRALWRGHTFPSSGKRVLQKSGLAGRR